MLALVILRSPPPLDILSLLILNPVSLKAYASNVADRFILSLLLKRFVPVVIRTGESFNESAAKS